MKHRPRSASILLAGTALLVITGAGLLSLTLDARPADGAPRTASAVPGGRGDGAANDAEAPAADPVAAIRAARAGDTVVVGSGTYAGSLTVPDGVTIVGQGMGASWLKGKITFGSNTVLRDLKVGDAGNAAVHNRPGATGAVFERVRFRGGGGERGWIGSSVISLGMDGSTSNLLFKDCEVERNLGSDPGFTNGYNNISVYENKLAHVSGITFDGCRVGVSNGVATGSPRMGLEAWTANLSENGSGIGWQNLTIRNCVFEATDAQCLDFADANDGRADGVLVEGNLLKGGGVTRVKWGYTICIESPSGVVIRNNTLYRGSEQTIMFANQHATGPGAVITGNTLNLDYANGIVPNSAYPVSMWGTGNRYTGNTMTYHGSASRAFELYNASNCTVTGNTFHIGSKEIFTKAGPLVLVSGNVSTGR